MPHLSKPTVAALMLMLLGMPVVARATTYYVKSTGSDAASGTSSAAAWATIGKANSRVAPGDVVVIANGTYAQFPLPAVAGTPGARISYVGNLASPSSVIVTPTGSLTKSDVSLKGITFAAGVYLAATRDSLAHCRVGGSMSGLSSANDCVIADTHFDSQRFYVVGSEAIPRTRCARDTVTRCSFTLNPNDAGSHTIRLGGVDALLFERCRFLIDVGPNAQGASCTKLFGVRHSKFVDCFWDITNRCVTNPDEAGWFVNRDSTAYNTWTRDTILMKGPGQVQFFGAASGSYPSTVMHNTYDHCVFKVAGPCAYGSAVYYQDRVQQDSLIGCVIVGSGGGLAFNTAMNGPMLIDHCTVVGFAPGGASLTLDPNVWSGTVVLRNSIAYTPLSVVSGARTAAASFNATGAQGHIVSNYNLFFNRSGRDSAISAWPLGMSRPGVGGVWCTNARADSNSLFGSPRFADTSSVLAFDAHLLPGSWAIGTGWGGGDVGALPFAGGADIVPPAAVANLGTADVRDNNLILTWTAPGGDGTSGQAAAYDLRVSTLPIADFAAATPVPNLPAPQPSGVTQTTVVVGLAPATMYYFALRVRDASNNWSPVSNMLSVFTRATDTKSPATVLTLGAR
jgi:hypothetical protein